MYRVLTWDCGLQFMFEADVELFGFIEREALHREESAQDASCVVQRHANLALKGRRQPEIEACVE